MRKLKTIGYVTQTVLASVKNDFFMGFAQYVQKRRDIIVRHIEPTQIGNAGVLDGLDGVIAHVSDKSILDRLRGSGLPIVFIGETRSGLIGVDIDSASAGTMAAEWFLRRGFRSFAYCGFRGLRGIIYQDDYEEAFSAAVAKAGCECRIYDEAAITKNSFERDHLANLLAGLNAWIPTLPTRTAVLCMHDRRALHVLNTCLQLGRTVPDDIAIMGMCNDVAICSCASVPISSIDMNMRGVAYAAMRIATNVIDKPVKPKPHPTFVVPPIGIVERASTNVYPVNPPCLSKALLLIDENIGRSISIPKLAKAVGVSRTTLQEAFRKSMGTSGVKYIQSVKMREAKHLVEEGVLNVKEISARLGFSSPSYFCRTYRAFFGIPPSRETRRGCR